MTQAVFLIPLDEYMNDENASEEWKGRVDDYIKILCGNYSGVPQSAVTCAEYLDKAVFGFDLYVTEDGSNFTRITDNGFGDPYNHGLRAFGITSEGLFIGTANPFYGTQVWKLTEDASQAGPKKLLIALVALIAVSAIAAAACYKKRAAKNRQ